MATRDYSMDRLQGKIATLAVNRTGNAITLISILGGKPIVVNATLAGGNNSVFNFVSTVFDGTTVHLTTDDVAPIRNQLGTVGSNHGFALNVGAWAPANHNKTTADLGSVWTDGSREYVLLAINSSGQAIFGGDYTVDGSGVVQSVNVAPTANLTHVSGATNTSDLNYTLKLGLATVQLYPAVGRKIQSIFVDSVPLTDGSTLSGTEFEVRESYEVLDYRDIYDKAKANIGISYGTLSIAGATRIESVYKFRKGGIASVDVALTEIKPTTLGIWNGVQSVALSGAVTRYLPGVKAVGGFNWSTGVDMSIYAVSQSIVLADLQATNIPPVLTLDSRSDVSFVLGIKPWSLDATSNAARIAETPTQLWDMRNSKKSYPGVIAGEAAGWGRKAFHGYRAYLTPEESANIAAVATDSMSAFSVLESSTVLP